MVGKGKGIPLYAWHHTVVHSNGTAFAIDPLCLQKIAECQAILRHIHLFVIDFYCHIALYIDYPASHLMPDTKSG